MKSFKLNAEPRIELGKKASKELRKESKIPVELNGGEIVELPYTGELGPGQKVVELCNNKGIITTDLTVNMEDVRKLIYTPDIFAIDLTFNGKTINAVLKDLQTHPVTDKILHIDLLEVNEKKPIVMEVPVKLEGHAEGVKAPSWRPFPGMERYGVQCTCMVLIKAALPEIFGMTNSKRRNPNLSPSCAQVAYQPCCEQAPLGDAANVSQSLSNSPD